MKQYVCDMCGLLMHNPNPYYNILITDKTSTKTCYSSWDLCVLCFDNIKELKEKGRKRED